MDDPQLTPIDGDGHLVTFHEPPASLTFCMDGVEVLKITKDRIIGNPAVHADEAATAILRALESQIRGLK